VDNWNEMCVIVMHKVVVLWILYVTFA
jgi:hypothetical protein